MIVLQARLSGLIRWVGTGMPPLRCSCARSRLIMMTTPGFQAPQPRSVSAVRVWRTCHQMIQVCVLCVGAVHVPLVVAVVVCMLVGVLLPHQTLLRFLRTTKMIMPWAVVGVAVAAGVAVLGAL